MAQTNSPGKNSEPVVIKKYANRRLYNTQTSTYVTLEDLAEMVKRGEDFTVQDAKTNDDITRSVLAQIIFELEGRGQNLLPIPFLRQLIQFYGDSIQTLVPSFLDMSLQNLVQQKDSLSAQMGKAFGVPVNIFEEQVKQNMKLFEGAFSMFMPGAAPAKENPETEMENLREQLKSMQDKLDKLLK